jgi:hypothetical protein
MLENFIRPRVTKREARAQELAEQLNAAVAAKDRAAFDATLETIEAECIWCCIIDDGKQFGEFGDFVRNANKSFERDTAEN